MGLICCKTNYSEAIELPAAIQVLLSSHNFLVKISPVVLAKVCQCSLIQPCCSPVPTFLLTCPNLVIHLPACPTFSESAITRPDQCHNNFHVRGHNKLVHTCTHLHPCKAYQFHHPREPKRSYHLEPAGARAGRELQSTVWNAKQGQLWAISPPSLTPISTCRHLPPPV